MNTYAPTDILTLLGANELGHELLYLADSRSKRSRSTASRMRSRIPRTISRRPRARMIPSGQASCQGSRLSHCGLEQQRQRRGTDLGRAVRRGGLPRDRAQRRRLRYLDLELSPLSQRRSALHMIDAVFAGEVNSSAVESFVLPATSHQNAYGKYANTMGVFASPYASDAATLLPSTTALSTLESNGLLSLALLLITPPSVACAGIGAAVLLERREIVLRPVLIFPVHDFSASFYKQVSLPIGVDAADHARLAPQW